MGRSMNAALGRMAGSLIALALGTLPGAAAADVVFDNFDGPGGGFHPTDNLIAAEIVSDPPSFSYSSLRSAARFTVPGTSYRLDSVTLPISRESDVPEALRVRLTEDAGGAPGATIETLIDGGGAWPAFAIPFTATFTLASSLHPALDAGTSYWIVVEPGDFPMLRDPYVEDYRWFQNTTGTTVEVLQQSESTPTLPTDPWPGPPFDAPLAFRIEGTPSDGVDCLTVTDPGNACDPQNEGCFGAVAYVYGIAKYEVTHGQYADFLNDVAAADPNGLYDSDWMYGITRMGSAGSYSYQATDPDDPVPARFYDALRYVNWLHNGRPVGPQDATTTEDGAYTFSGPATVGARNPGAAFALPTEDEWYKAAYYDPGLGIYFDFPAGSDTLTSCSMPTAAPNSANCDLANGFVAAVGSYPGSPSPNGTFDQGGNLWEWNETVVGSDRVVRGGAWHIPASFLSVFARHSIDPATPLADTNAVGFRVACLPEPGTAVSLLAGSAALLGLAAANGGRRRR